LITTHTYDRLSESHSRDVMRVLKVRLQHRVELSKTVVAERWLFQVVVPTAEKAMHCSTVKEWLLWSGDK